MIFTCQQIEEQILVNSIPQETKTLLLKHFSRTLYIMCLKEKKTFDELCNYFNTNKTILQQQGLLAIHVKLIGD